VRRRVSTAVLIVVGTLLAGCGQEAVAGTNERPPAATAGRACQLIEYDVVATALGTQFDTAGGAQSGDTYTCVLGVQGKPYPDLTFAMSPTTVSPLIFSVTVPPSGATAVDQLGVSAYQVVLPPVSAPDGTASGTGLEVCWLSSRNLMVVMRYTYQASATPDDMAKIAAGLVVLAKQVDAQLTTI
jgi:hypothetical protein